jgi:FAD-dependent urate hydroxylase
VAAVHRVNGFPCLSPSFESSVAGLHFVGAPAAWTFGPLMCFVAGARFAAERLSRHLRAERHVARRG